MTVNDQILNGEQPDGEFYRMCGKCGDSYPTDKATYLRYKDVRWRCNTCVYAWL